MAKLNVDGLLSNQALFRDVSPVEMERLQNEVVKVELDKGQMLFRKGEMAQGVYAVVYGLMKLSIPSVEGGEKVLELIRPGQNFGEAMIFLDEPYPFCAAAAENTLLLRVPPGALFRLLDSSPLMAREMMAGMSARLLGFIHNVERCSLQNATQRVIEYLLQAATMQQTNEIRLDLKKNLVASLLNLAPATLSRVLHQLIDQQLIKVSGPLIHIGNEAALKSYQHGPAMLH